VSEYGKTLFSTIKSGANVLAIASKNSGKTTAALVACFNTINKAYEGAPRILFVCANHDAALALSDKMKRVAKPLDVTVDLAHDRGNMIEQRNDIFNGTEIIVGTIKRVFDLYIQNGINTSLLDYLVFDDFDDILLQGKTMEIKRIIDGLGKTQVICLANENTKRVEQFEESSPLIFKKI
jgi:superfamily II DNA/RNA helicase